MNVNFKVRQDKIIIYMSNILECGTMDSSPYGRQWHDGKNAVFCVTLLLFQVICGYSKSSTQQWYITHIGAQFWRDDSRARTVCYLDINLSSYVNYYLFCQDIH